ELLDQDLRIYPVLEPLHVQTLVPEFAVEGLVHAIQPRLSWIDERRVDVQRREPLEDRPGDEFRAIITPEVSGRSVHAHQLGENLDDPRGADAAGDIDGQTLSRILIDHRQALQLLTIGTGIEHEIICPQISRACCRQRARAARRNTSPRPPSRDLQTTLAPQPVSSIGAHPVSSTLQEDLDAPIARAGSLPFALLKSGSSSWAPRSPRGHFPKFPLGRKLPSRSPRSIRGRRDYISGRTQPKCDGTFFCAWREC